MKLLSKDWLLSWWLMTAGNLADFMKAINDIAVKTSRSVNSILGNTEFELHKMKGILIVAWY